MHSSNHYIPVLKTIIIFIMLFMSLSIKQKGIIMAEETKRDIKVFIDDSAISPGLPAEDLLREIAMRLIKDHFAHDLSMSYSIRLDISLIDRTKVQYELKAMFLYRESYTAVSHRIVFYISGKNPLPLTVE